MFCQFSGFWHRNRKGGPDIILMMPVVLNGTLDPVLTLVFIIQKMAMALLLV